MVHKVSHEKIKMHRELEKKHTLHWEKYLKIVQIIRNVINKALLKSVNAIISSTESPMVILNATQNKHFH